MRYEVSVHDLRVNAAQMRTRMGLQELAQLAVQVRNGLDPNLPISLGPDGKGAFNVISGHRRWLALMIAHIAYKHPTAQPSSAEQDLELMQATIEDVCTVEDGFVILEEGLYESLRGLVPEELTVPYILWDGPAADEILLLIKANMGAEEPDLLGQANAFSAAIERGVSYDTLAQAVGQPVGKLHALVALLDLPLIFRSLINDDLLDLSITVDLQALKWKAVKALGQALNAKYKADKKQAAQERIDLKGYTSRVHLAIVQLGVEPLVPDRKDVAPENYNLATVTKTLWEKGLESSPARLYKVIAARALEGHRLSGALAMIEVMAKVPKLQDRFDVIEAQFGHVRVSIRDETIKDLMPELDCSACAFIELPPERVRNELPFPCRQKSTGVASGPCLHWVPKGGRFSIRTPWHWSKGGEATTTFKKLLAAWQAQWNREKGAAQASGKSEGMKEQRGFIRYYMERHTEPPFMVDHPWATLCARCEHHLDKSPVKSDPGAPHCAWSKGKRRLRFEAYVPEAVTDLSKVFEAIPKGRGLLVPCDPSRGTIPCCGQFKPTAAWSELVPEADTPAPFDRDMLLSMILEVSSSVNRNVYSTEVRAALQFLTGRPELASQFHRRTFKGLFVKEAEALSDLQLWTLLQWLFLEWMRVQGHTSHQVMPLGGGETLETRIVHFPTAVHWSKEDSEEEDTE